MTSIPISTHDSPPFLLDLIYRMKVKDVMTRELVTARKESTLREIKQLMKDKAITGVPITEPEHKRILGLVSMDDIIQALDGGYIDTPAERHMSRNLIVLEEDMPLQFAISYLDKFRYGRFPVLNRERELVGIITSRDIIVALLVEVNKEVEKLEKKIVNPVAVAGEDIHLEFAIRKLDFENAGKASTEIKKVLKNKQLDPRTIRRIAVASYELEMNQVVHAEGGTISFAMRGDRVEITARDEGPGIEDVNKALEEGFSTANEWVRSLGFGAGMGLPNVRRVSDEFSIQSKLGEGTTVRSVIFTTAAA
ncbi:MAG: CBS domain-containing protein [Desulfococcus multivorans]|jgi:CBS domain-containing protein|nr:CBS domain-containing protein [Desulfococcus multivorans]